MREWREWSGVDCSNERKGEQEPQRLGEEEEEEEEREGKGN